MKTLVLIVILVVLSTSRKSIDFDKIDSAEVLETLIRQRGSIIYQEINQKSKEKSKDDDWISNDKIMELPIICEQY